MGLTLDRIVGQDVTVTILKRSLAQNTLAHAYLFSGPPGLGKRTTAEAVAEELLRRGGKNSELHILEGTGSIGVNQIRALRRRAAYATSSNLIWIIKDAERMTVPACNAFLKTLEEPQKGTYFFLTTTNVHNLLPTIISRCQHLPFRTIAAEQIELWLAERGSAEPGDPRIKAVTRLARGSLGRARDYWEGPLLQQRAEILEKIISVPTAGYPEVLGMSYSWPENREEIFSDLQLILEWHRDLLTVKSDRGLPLYHPDYEQELIRISNYYSSSYLLWLIQQVAEMRRALQGNARIRFCLGYLLLLMKKGALT